MNVNELQRKDAEALESYIADQLSTMSPFMVHMFEKLADEVEDLKTQLKEVTEKAAKYDDLCR